MIRALLLTSAVTLSLTGCARIADSRFNPFNWFGRSTETTTATAPAEIRPLVPEGRRTQVVDQRALVARVTALQIDRSTSGAIVRATGVAATQGAFNAELVSRGVENGTLLLEFRAEVPAGFQAVGSERSRRITAAYAIDMSDLAGIRAVRVQGATNAQTSRR